MMNLSKDNAILYVGICKNTSKQNATKIPQPKLIFPLHFSDNHLSINGRTEEPCLKS